MVIGEPFQGIAMYEFVLKPTDTNVVQVESILNGEYLGFHQKKIATSEDEHVIMLSNDTGVELQNYENDVVEQFCYMTNKCFARRANEWRFLLLWNGGKDISRPSKFLI